MPLSHTCGYVGGGCLVLVPFFGKRAKMCTSTIHLSVAFVVQWRWLEMNAFTAIRTNEAYLKLERLSSTGPRIALRIRNKTVGIN